MKQFVAKNFQTIVIVGLLVLFFILFNRSCGGGDDKNAARESEFKQLQARYRADSIAHGKERNRWQDSIAHAGLNSDLQVKVIKETEKKLAASQSRINQLTAVIRNADHSPDTTNMILVSADFKDACDSLPNEIDKLNTNIGQLQKDNTDLVDLMNYEIVYRDSLIEASDQQIGNLNNTISHKNSVIDQVLRAAKPRGRLLGGVGLIGNETQFLGGTKINIAYQSKGGKQYQVGGILMKGGVWYEASVLITLIK
jgi:hypothetical protein